MPAVPRFIMDEGGPSVIDPQICEFRAFDARFGAAEGKDCHVHSEFIMILHDKLMTLESMNQHVNDMPIVVRIEYKVVFSWNGSCWLKNEFTTCGATACSCLPSRYWNVSHRPSQREMAKDICGMLGANILMLRKRCKKLHQHRPQTATHHVSTKFSRGTLPRHDDGTECQKSRETSPGTLPGTRRNQQMMMEQNAKE